MPSWKKAKSSESSGAVQRERERKQWHQSIMLAATVVRQEMRSGTGSISPILAVVPGYNNDCVTHVSAINPLINPEPLHAHYMTGVSAGTN